MMETEAGKAEFMADLERIFFESDSENMGSLTGQDLWILNENFNAHHDTLEDFQGHWILDKKVWDQDIDWYKETLGTGCRITYDRWIACFPIYMSKILPNLKE